MYEVLKTSVMDACTNAHVLTLHSSQRLVSQSLILSNEFKSEGMQHTVETGMMTHTKYTARCAILVDTANDRSRRERLVQLNEI